MLLRWGLALNALVVCLLCNSCCSSAVEVRDFAGGPQVTVEDSKLLTHADSQDVVLLSPQYTVELSGIRGVMRLLLGFTLILGTILYAMFVTYPKAMPPFKDLFVQAKQVADVVAGEVPRSKAEIILERLESYAEKNPEEVFLHAAAFSTGLLLWLWGLAALRKPRRARLVGI